MLDELANFLACAFYQSYSVDYATEDEAALDYLNGCTSEMRRTIEAQLDGLLRSNDPTIAEFVASNAFYLPRADWGSERAWLEHLRTLVPRG